MLVEHGNFRTPYSGINVNGSWLRASFHTTKTTSGRLVRISFHAIDPNCAVIAEGCTPPDCKDGDDHSNRYVLTDGAPTYVVDNLKISLHRKTLTVATGQWTTMFTSTVGRRTHARFG